MSFDYRSDIREYLIAGGVSGRKQRDITFQFRSVCTAAEIAEVLDTWLEEDKVQRFVMPGRPNRGRPPVIWRATTKIMED